MPRVWIEPVYDRTQEDVDRIKEMNQRGFFNLSPNEQTLWRTDMKGALNRSDLERIENDIQILSDTLELHLTTYVDNIPELPNVSYFTNLKNNVKAIRDTGFVHNDTPITPNQPLNYFTKINDIEKILYDIDHILESNFFYWCMDPTQLYAGDTIGTLL